MTNKLRTRPKLSYFFPPMRKAAQHVIKLSTADVKWMKNVFGALS